jgi:peptidoglycan/LPS O-acetylase OafA/YrhL
MAAHGDSQRGRVAQLDSLRGIAAATVVWHHWQYAFYTGPPRWFLYPLVAGHEAVILFFVLSGYVLSLPVWRQRAPGYPEYLVRRVSRVYVPYLAAAALAGVGCYFFMGSRLPLTPWFLATWQTPLSASLIFRQILMDPKPLLNTAFWSLRYEMEMSIVFPLLCFLMVRTGRYSSIVLVLLTREAAHLFAHSRFDGSELSLTLYYGMFFIAGAALSREQETLKKLIARAGKPVLWLALLFALLAYFNGAVATGIGRSTDLVTLVGTCGLLILIQDPRLHLGLRSAPAEYLGRVSYSSYLVHGTVLFAMLNLLYGRIPILALAFLYGIATLIVAHVFCVFVEEPSHRAGKRLARWMRNRKVERNVEVEVMVTK